MSARESSLHYQVGKSLRGIERSRMTFERQHDEIRSYEVKKKLDQENKRRQEQIKLRKLLAG